MLLSKPQQLRFWREWSIACKAQGWTKVQSWTGAQIENERYSLLQRAGFDSLTLVDPLAGFDRVLAELAALSRPADLSPQLRAQEQPRRRLWYAIQKLGFQISTSELQGGRESSYVAAIMLDRFGHCDHDRLSLQQLEQLRNTLASRATAHKRKHQERHLQPAETDNKNPF